MPIPSIRRIEQALDDIRAALPLAPEHGVMENGLEIDGDVCGVCGWFDSHEAGCFVGKIQDILATLD
jgi:hypothetical protein